MKEKERIAPCGKVIHMVRCSHVGAISKTVLERIRSFSDVLLQIAPTGLGIEPLLSDHGGRSKPTNMLQKQNCKTCL